MEIIEKVKKVGSNSLMVLINKDICKRLKIESGDYVKLNIKKMKDEE